MAKTLPIDPAASAAVHDPLIGHRLGEYQVERFIAQGGMGMVYSAVHPLLKRRAAVKVLRPELVRDREQEERFLKEGQALGSIRHRGIIDVYDFGRLPDGRYFMMMEFLEGRTLEQLLHEEGPLPPARALPIIDEILDALTAAHNAGVVHRDLKPSNVFMAMQSNGTAYAKLMDFGLAKSVGGGREAKASVIAGTPEYISPEQARGDTVTPATDLYCLGVMIFEMLSGGLPFAGNNMVEFLRAHLEQPAPRLSSFVQVPDSVDDLVAELLNKAPEDRPRSAEAVRRTVRQIMRETRDASTLQVPVEHLSEAPESERLGDYPLEDTQISGKHSRVGEDEVKAVRERATGGPQSQAVRRSSGSNLPRPNKSGPVQPLPTRQSQPGVKRPSGGGLAPLPTRQERAARESQRKLPSPGPSAGAAKPLEPVGPDQQTSPPTQRSARRITPLAYAGLGVAVVLMSVGGVSAVWWLRRQDARVSTTMVEAVPPAAEEKPPPQAPEPTPAAAALSPEEEKALAARLKEVAERERARGAEASKDEAVVNFRQLALDGVRAGKETNAGKLINSGLAAELAQDREKELRRQRELTEGQKARHELVQEKEATEAKERFRVACEAKGWKKKATTEVEAKTQARRRELMKDPDAYGVEDELVALKADETEFKTLIKDADTFDDCLRVQKLLPTVGLSRRH